MALVGVVLLTAPLQVPVEAEEVATVGMEEEEAVDLTIMPAPEA